MKNLIPQILRSAADAGGGGGAADAGAAGSGAADAGAAVASGATGGQPAPSAGEPAAGGDPAPAAGQFYRPEGLPAHMHGKDQNETMDNMAKALEGYRSRDAANSVPDTPEAYGQFTGDIPEAIKPHLDTLTADPLFGRVSAKAHEMKVSVPQYQALAQEFLSVSQEMGLMEPIIDEAAEREALTPDTAKHLPAKEQQQAREQRMNDNYAFVDAMVAKDGKGLAKEDADFAKAMLGDSAKGHRFFEAIRQMNGGAPGGGPGMGASPAPARSGADELRRRQELPENTVGHKEFSRASYDQLNADYEKFHGK